jgi:hypothetical protein
MTSHDTTRRPVVVAAITASFLILTGGLTYRALAARLGAPVNRAPVDPAALDRLPLEIGGWTGQDVPLDEAIVRKTGTDAHINRRYSRGNGSESISLYIACGVTARALMPHRPEVCYVGAGWTLVDRQPTELPLNDGTTLPCSIFQFSRGGLNAEGMIVIDYFIVDGQYCGDVSLLRSRAWRGSATVRYVAQVQIVASIGAATTDSVTRLVSAFAVDSASLIARLFEGVGSERILGKSCESATE